MRATTTACVHGSPARALAPRRRGGLPTLALLAGAGAVLLSAGAALGDGMYVPPPDTVVVEMEAQRGVLWVRAEGGVDLTVQTRYSGAAEDFGWIVPLPERPVVTEASVEMLDQLDWLTAPKFYRRSCYIPCPDHYGGDADADADGQISRPDDAVIEWESGTVGALDYSVISGSDGGGLADWLADNSFATVDGLEDMLEVYASEGAFFFAARVSPGADISGGVTPVTFSLPNAEEPTFPMRLTGLSPVDSIRVVLFVVAEEAHAPLTYPYETVEPRPMSVEEYGEELDRLSSAGDHDVFVAQHVLPLPWDALEVAEDRFGHSIEPEIHEILGSHLWVSRYVADLATAAMARDVVFEPVVRFRVGNEFVSPCPTEVVREDCSEDWREDGILSAGGGACRASAEEPSSPAAALVFLCVLAALVARRALGRW